MNGGIINFVTRFHLVGYFYWVNHYKSDSSSLYYIYHTYVHSSPYPCISLLSL